MTQGLGQLQRERELMMMMMMMRMRRRKGNSRRHEEKMFEPWKIKRRRRRSTRCTLTHHNSQVCVHSRSMPASDGFKTTRLHQGRGLNHWALSASSSPSSLLTLFFHEKPFSWQLLHRIDPFWDSFSYALSHTLLFGFSPPWMHFWFLVMVLCPF